MHDKSRQVWWVKERQVSYIVPVNKILLVYLQANMQIILVFSVTLAVATGMYARATATVQLIMPGITVRLHENGVRLAGDMKGITGGNFRTGIPGQ